MLRTFEEVVPADRERMAADQLRPDLAPEFLAALPEARLHLLAQIELGRAAEQADPVVAGSRQILHGLAYAGFKIGADAVFPRLFKGDEGIGRIAFEPVAQRFGDDPGVDHSLGVAVGEGGGNAAGAVQLKLGADFARAALVQELLLKLGIDAVPGQPGQPVRDDQPEDIDFVVLEQLGGQIGLETELFGGFADLFRLVWADPPGAVQRGGNGGDGGAGIIGDIPQLDSAHTGRLPVFENLPKRFVNIFIL